jgi:integrase
VVSDTDLAKLVQAASGWSFEDWRDTAMLRLLIDSGMRAGELLHMRVSDLGVAIVIGKGRRPRSCPFGSKAATALDRYLRARAKHPHAASAALWIGRAAVLTYAAFANCSIVAATKPGSLIFMPTSCATASRTPTSRMAVTRETLCSWLAVTGHAQPVRSEHRVRTCEGRLPSAWHRRSFRERWDHPP